jgi:hypothetical protein
MERKRVGGEWVLIQDEDRLTVRASWAGHMTGVAVLLVVGVLGLALGLCLIAGSCG